MPNAKPAPAKSGNDELMRKFKAALDAKTSGDSDPNASGAKGSGHAQETHGPAEQKRVFRRKSG